jgi:hypothetical protein
MKRFKTSSKPVHDPTTPVCVCVCVCVCVWCVCVCVYVHVCVRACITLRCLLLQQVQ